MAVGTGFGQLFRGIGQVGGVAVSSALFQTILTSELHKRIHDADAEEASFLPSLRSPRLTHPARITVDHQDPALVHARRAAPATPAARGARLVRDLSPLGLHLRRGRDAPRVPRPAPGASRFPSSPLLPSPGYQISPPRVYRVPLLIAPLLCRSPISRSTSRAPAHGPSGSSRTRTRRPRSSRRKRAGRGSRAGARRPRRTARSRPTTRTTAGRRRVRVGRGGIGCRRWRRRGGRSAACRRMRARMGAWTWRMRLLGGRRGVDTTGVWRVGCTSTSKKVTGSTA